MNPIWFSAFHAVSSFNNSGLVLLSDNLVPFAQDRFILLITSIEILLGNCFSPVSLRLIIWAAHRTRRDDEALSLLLHFPRTTFTHLFGSEATVVLCLWIIVYTVIEIVIFLGTNWRNSFLQVYGPSTRALISFFQGISTRTAGFNAVLIMDLSAPMQFVYWVFMYLST